MDDKGARLEWKWREYFTRNAVLQGMQDERMGKLKDFQISEDGREASAETPNHFRVWARVPRGYADFKRYPHWTDLLTHVGARNAYHYSHYYSCTCSQGSNGMRCRHLANLLLHWEAVSGPFVIEETEAEHAERLKEEARAREKARLQRQVYRTAELFSAVHPKGGAPCFNPNAMSDTDITVNGYELKQAGQLAEEGNSMSCRVVYGYDGQQRLEGIGRFEDYSAAIQMTRNKLEKLNCNCGGTVFRDDTWYRRDSRPGGTLCRHTYALWQYMRDVILTEDPGDETDQSGDRLLALLSEETEAAVPAAVGQPQDPRRREVVLVPRILRENNFVQSLKLGFDIGVGTGRRYVVRGLQRLVNAVEEKEVLTLGKSLTVNFAESAFTEDSERWYKLIASRVRGVRSTNAKLDRGYYGYHMSAGDGIPLEESDLDQVYELCEGGELLYQYGARNEVCAVRVGEARPRATVRLELVKRKEKPVGVKVTGEMSRLLQGSLHRYVLDRECFGRVSDGELGLLRVFHALGEEDGTFSGVIGVKNFPEFFHRLLPRLREAGEVEVIDGVSDQLEHLLPPEPEFDFYVDLEGDNLTCRAEVTYGDRRSALGFIADAADRRERDIAQERRVESAVRACFIRKDAAAMRYWTKADEDNLAMALTETLPALSAYGTVRVSDAFGRVKLRPAPQPKLSLRVEGGLLDLAVQTKDISHEELLELLDSYHRRKRWHRLRDGDFVDLRQTEALDALEATVAAMDVPLDKLILEGAQVPKYRALYVDRLLEAHDAVAASRDRQFKALVRTFQTIKDSDFEVSEGLSDVLRPYQVYGFRWLSTLAQAGFGGILADEMGLGKTVELLAFLQARKAAGETRPALVVCPASLVYNWREECRRFTPDMTVETLDGNLPRRKKLIAALKGDDPADLYITSYDLLKRDITLYEGVTFSTMALDEAQYVKNATAAVSKAVRVLSAEQRFALTGTPIENRLSELWSIFDFLMPGFLYSAREFAARFETPIMKQKDAEATAKLARMTEPFILRRRKEDVLKDLPEKLEEARSFAMESDQRRLYDAQVVRMRKLLEETSDTAKDKLRVLAEITRLRQLCCDPSLLFEDYHGSSAKRAACLELIQNAIDGGHRMLLFSQFTSMLSLLADDLKAAGIPFYTITGATPKQERLNLVNAFNGGDTPVFLISLKAGGTGLNLTGADLVIHYDPWWNLAVQNQATDRAHRIGQTRQVTVIRLIAAETIEEKIVRLQEAKRDLAESIITGEGESLMSLSREELMELIG